MSEATTALITTCAYFETDSYTGERNACTEPAISPTLPYCYHHAEKIGKLTKKKEHDRYGGSMPDHLREKYNHQLEDDKPLNLVQEIAHTRAMITDHLELIKSTVTPEGTILIGPKDKVLIDMLLGRIAKLAEVEARINPRDFMPIEEVKNMLKGIIEIIAKSIPSADVELRKHIVNNIKKFCEEKVGSNTVKPLVHGSKQRTI